LASLGHYLPINPIISGKTIIFHLALHESPLQVTHTCPSDFLGEPFDTGDVIGVTMCVIVSNILGYSSEELKGEAEINKPSHQLENVGRPTSLQSCIFYDLTYRHM
jgi:hypothetical protein